MDSSLADNSYGVSEEVLLYSIVNSLCEASDIGSVQVSINGKTDRTLKGNMDLSEIYSRNMDLVE